MGKIEIAAIGGALIAYGLIARNKRIIDLRNPLMSKPDSVSRTDGNIALVLGAILLLGAFI